MTPDTSAEEVGRLADALERSGLTIAAATLRALLAERDELRASFDLRWKADMRAIRLRREQSQDDDNLTWPDHADLVVWLLAERDRLAAEVERLRGALKKIIAQDWWDATTQQGDEADTVDGRCAEIARAALAGEGKSND